MNSSAASKKNPTLQVSELMIQRFECEYQPLNVRQEIIKAQNWWVANPRKRKLPAGEYKFLVNWLNGAHAKVCVAQVQARMYARVGQHEGQRPVPSYKAEVDEILKRYPDLGQ